LTKLKNGCYSSSRFLSRQSIGQGKQQEDNLQSELIWRGMDKRKIEIKKSPKNLAKN